MNSKRISTKLKKGFPFKRKTKAGSGLHDVDEGVYNDEMSLPSSISHEIEESFHDETAERKEKSKGKGVFQKFRQSISVGIKPIKLSKGKGDSKAASSSDDESLGVQLKTKGKKKKMIPEEFESVDSNIEANDFMMDLDNQFQATEERIIERKSKKKKARKSSLEAKMDEEPNAGGVKAKKKKKARASTLGTSEHKIDTSILDEGPDGKKKKKKPRQPEVFHDEYGDGTEHASQIDASFQEGADGKKRKKKKKPRQSEVFHDQYGEGIEPVYGERGPYSEEGITPKKKKKKPKSSLDAADSMFGSPAQDGGEGEVPPKKRKKKRATEIEDAFPTEDFAASARSTSNDKPKLKKKKSKRKFEVDLFEATENDPKSNHWKSHGDEAKENRAIAPSNVEPKDTVLAYCIRNSADQPVPFQLIQDNDGAILMQQIDPKFQKATGVQEGQRVLEIQDFDVATYHSLQAIEAIVEETLDLSMVLMKASVQSATTTSPQTNIQFNKEDDCVAGDGGGEQKPQSQVLQLDPDEYEFETDTEGEDDVVPVPPKGVLNDPEHENKLNDGDDSSFESYDSDPSEKENATREAATPHMEPSIQENAPTKKSKCDHDQSSVESDFLESDTAENGPGDVAHTFPTTPTPSSSKQQHTNSVEYDWESDSSEEEAKNNNQESLIDPTPDVSNLVDENDQSSVESEWESASEKNDKVFEEIAKEPSIEPTHDASNLIDENDQSSAGSGEWDSDRRKACESPKEIMTPSVDTMRNLVAPKSSLAKMRHDEKSDMSPNDTSEKGDGGFEDMDETTSGEAPTKIAPELDTTETEQLGIEDTDESAEVGDELGEDQKKQLPEPKTVSLHNSDSESDSDRDASDDVGNLNKISTQTEVREEAKEDIHGGDPMDPIQEPKQGEAKAEPALLHTKNPAADDDSDDSSSSSIGSSGGSSSRSGSDTVERCSLPKQDDTEGGTAAVEPPVADKKDEDAKVEAKSGDDTQEGGNGGGLFSNFKRLFGSEIQEPIQTRKGSAGDEDSKGEQIDKCTEQKIPPDKSADPTDEGNVQEASIGGEHASEPLDQSDLTGKPPTIDEKAENCSGSGPETNDDEPSNAKSQDTSEHPLFSNTKKLFGQEAAQNNESMPSKEAESSDTAEPQTCHASAEEEDARPVPAQQLHDEQSSPVQLLRGAVTAVMTSNILVGEQATDDEERAKESDAVDAEKDFMVQEPPPSGKETKEEPASPVQLLLEAVPAVMTSKNLAGERSSASSSAQLLRGAVTTIMTTNILGCGQVERTEAAKSNDDKETVKTVDPAASVSEVKPTSPISPHNDGDETRAKESQTDRLLSSFRSFSEKLLSPNSLMSPSNRRLEIEKENEVKMKLMLEHMSFDENKIMGGSEMQDKLIRKQHEEKAMVVEDVSDERSIGLNDKLDSKSDSYSVEHTESEPGWIHRTKGRIENQVSDVAIDVNEASGTKRFGTPTKLPEDFLKATEAAETTGASKGFAAPTSLPEDFLQIPSTLGDEKTNEKERQLEYSPDLKDGPPAMIILVHMKKQLEGLQEKLDQQQVSNARREVEAAALEKKSIEQEDQLVKYKEMYEDLEDEYDKVLAKYNDQVEQNATLLWKIDAMKKAASAQESVLAEKVDRIQTLVEEVAALQKSNDMKQLEDLKDENAKLRHLVRIQKESIQAALQGMM